MWERIVIAFCLRQKKFSEIFSAPTILEQIMQQAIGTPISDKDNEIITREPWERPTLERLAAQEAQDNVAGSSDLGTFS